MRFFPLAVLLFAAAPVSTRPPVIEVQLSSFAFAPETLRLRAGAPVTLRLVNAGSGGHNFSAPEFFAAVTIAPGQGAIVARGAIEVPARGSIEIALTPARGRYVLRCTHILHTAFGMRGEIVVE
ncbi:MAG: cupredoxin domain-containing protein [Sphingomonas sp.]|nr:cupredoxin domain-containing protein [Sphingomonas sp.]